MTIELHDWRERAAALADTLVEAGKVWSPQWIDAVRQTPRHLFVPEFHTVRDGRATRVDAVATPQRWADAVYANEALVTLVAQRDGGYPEFLSSSSAPGLMTRMLESLDIAEHHRVLEIGTGTGYNVALLCHRLPDTAVVSVDVEPDLVARARTRLADLGHHPTLITGDGLLGVPEHAPYDRIVSTCAVPRVPWAWVEQTRIGGVILTDLKVDAGAGNLVRLTRTAPDRAEGVFDAGQAWFMSARPGPGATPNPGSVIATSTTVVARRHTTIDPRIPWSNPLVWFLAAMLIGPLCRYGYSGDDPANAPDAVFLATPDGSRADVTLIADDTGGHPVRAVGPVDLWAYVEHAHAAWVRAGELSWPRVHLVVTPDDQTVLLDDGADLVEWARL